ncbi:MAG: rhomboid family intramembrane serine protease [Nitrososphaerales archaeon]
MPIARPKVTYVLLGVILLVFVADLVVTQLTGDRIVFILGAQWNQAVAAGWYWQLLTSTFLHAGLTHLAFNAYALYILGRDIEGLYGSLWFTVLYFLAGLGGSVAWYLLGTNEPSVGASGAIFGLIGAEAAFFLRNRQLFGAFGRQRLINVAVLLVINFALGFTIPNVNYIAHLGGLVTGFLIGMVLTPSYALTWSQDTLGMSQQRLLDTRTNRQRVLAAAVALVILLALVVAGNPHWAV